MSEASAPERTRIGAATVAVGALLMFLAPNLATGVGGFVRGMSAALNGGEAALSSGAEALAYSASMMPLTLTVILVVALGLGFWIGRRASGPVAGPVWLMTALGVIANVVVSALILNGSAIRQALAAGPENLVPVLVGAAIGVLIPLVVEAGLVFLGVWLGRLGGRKARAVA